LISTRFP